MGAPIALQPMAARLYAWLEPLNQDAHDGGLALAALCDAATTTREMPAAVSADPGLLLRPADTPDEAVRWLAQLAGVRRRAAETIPALRQRIEDGDGRLRGRQAGMVAAAKRTLTGSADVFYWDRTNPAHWDTDDFYHLVIVTRDTQTPDPGRTLAELVSVKRFGFQLHYLVAETWIVYEAETDYATVGDIEAAFADIDAMEHHVA